MHPSDIVRLHHQFCLQKDSELQVSRLDTDDDENMVKE
jgi:hypothetical protein